MISDLPPEPPVKYEQVVSQPASIWRRKPKSPPFVIKQYRMGLLHMGRKPVTPV